MVRPQLLFGDVRLAAVHAGGCFVNTEFNGVDQQPDRPVNEPELSPTRMITAHAVIVELRRIVGIDRLLKILARCHPVPGTTTPCPGASLRRFSIPSRPGVFSDGNGIAQTIGDLPKLAALGPEKDPLSPKTAIRG